MAHGYVSDADDDDTVMDSPHVTVSIDATNLSPQQAAALIDEKGVMDVDPYVYGELVDGNNDYLDNVGTIDFHFPLGVGFQLLASVGAIEQPTDGGDTDVESE